jgi:hypothetical protein
MKLFDKYRTIKWGNEIPPKECECCKNAILEGGLNII